MTIKDLQTLITLRLSTFGYTATEDDQSFIQYVAGHAIQYVCSYCHFKSSEGVPNSLQYVATDYAVGEFLQYKKTFAPSDLSGLNLDYAVKQIQTGDTSTTFATGDGCQTDEQRLDSLITQLMAGGKTELYAHRRIRW